MAEDDAERPVEARAFGVSPPTPTASSAGPSLGVQGNNHASIDWHGLAPRKASISGTSAGPPRPAVSTSTAAVSGSSSYRLLCRPWDCGDLLRRLATFKLSSWNQKPQVIGPAVCARKGWVNVDVDMIACEGCDTQLSFSVPGLSQPEVEAAAESFREQLEAGHQASCPWKGNACAESLAQFPSSAMALIGGYNDRCDALLQLHSLPVISAIAIDHMKLSRGPQIDRLLSQPPLIPELEVQDRMGTESTFCKAQRIISFCGWEARLLPHAADFEDNSAQSTRNACLKKASHKRGKRNSMPKREREERGRLPIADMRYNPASCLLECIYCGANVNIFRFQTVARPAQGGTSAAGYPDSGNKCHTLIRGASAASSIDVRRRRPSEEAVEAATSEQKQVQLTHAVPRGSQSNLNTAADMRGDQPEGSEMGDCGAASYESRGPRDDQHGTGQGDSSVYVPQLRAESAGGTNGDGDGEDEGKSCAAESSKRKRVPESLAADQHSLGMAVSGNATSEPDADAEVGNDRKNKRVCIGPSTSEPRPVERTVSIDNTLSRNRRSLTVRHENIQRRVTGEFPCSSSVNATDTCFQNKMENSIDSVEYMPQDDAQQHTAASAYTENEWLFDEPNSTVQGQQSTSYAPVPLAGERSDTNAAVISSGTATNCGGSVGMTGIHIVSQRVQSNEADIQETEFSGHQTGSVAGEAEVVIDAVVDQGEIGLVCDSAPIPAAVQDGNNDSRVEHNSTKDLGDESGESGSKASLRPRNGYTEEDRTIDTTNALIMGCSTGTITKEATDGSVEVAARGDDERAIANSAPAGKDPEDVHQNGEFDPIRCHRGFCPWVNGLVLAAANGTFGSSAICGWQLTVDALEAFYGQDVPTKATESESTASMCKDEASKPLLAQGSSSHQCNGSSRLEPS